MKSDKAFTVLCGIFLAIIVVTQVTLVFHHKAPASVTVGSADIGVLSNYPTLASAWVGTSDTLVVASSSGRIRLEINNLSGATTTPQAVYCNTGDRPAVKYTGIVIQASSTKIFNLDELPRGAIHCVYPVSASTVTVVDW
jgi:hypothetical protein